MRFDNDRAHAVPPSRFSHIFCLWFASVISAGSLAGFSRNAQTLIVREAKKSTEFGLEEYAFRLQPIKQCGKQIPIFNPPKRQILSFCAKTLDFIAVLV